MNTKIPLPYWILANLPIFDNFRAPSRFILLAWTGAAVLAAVSLKALLSSIKVKSTRIFLFIIVILGYSWEMGLGSINGWTTPLNDGKAYQFLKTDPGQGGVLEVPVAVNKQGDISINAQAFMLHQPIHEKPLVLGRPPRQTKRSLEFIESTDFVYELTHPAAIRSLYSDPKLKARRDLLIREGRQRLQKNKIDFVLLHTRNRFFSKEIIDH